MPFRIFSPRHAMPSPQSSSAHLHVCTLLTCIRPPAAACQRWPQAAGLGQFRAFAHQRDRRRRLAELKEFMAVAERSVSRPLMAKTREVHHQMVPRPDALPRVLQLLASAHAGVL